MATLIADECPSKRPFVFFSGSQRLVIYCKYGEDALEDDSAIDSLAFNPTAGEWSLSAPCLPEDLGWMSRSLESRAPRIHVRDGEITDDDKATSISVVEIDWSALKAT